MDTYTLESCSMTQDHWSELKIYSLKKFHSGTHKPKQEIIPFNQEESSVRFISYTDSLSS